MEGLIYSVTLPREWCINLYCILYTHISYIIRWYGLVVISWQAAALW